jgi:hypothetical protein
MYIFPFYELRSSKLLELKNDWSPHARGGDFVRIGRPMFGKCNRLSAAIPVAKDFD